MPQSDVELAYKTITAKRLEYDRLFAYYDGNQPLIYSTRRLQEAFNKLDAKFCQNWLAVVVDSALDRLNLLRYTINNDETATERLNQLFTDTELELDSYDVHLATLVTGEAYVIVWPDEETEEPSAYYNDPRNVHLFYEADRPKVKRFGAKMWCDDEGKLRMTLYYPDRLEYYISTKAAKNVTSAKSLVPIPETEGEWNPGHEYGIIPVFHFRRERRAIVSEMAKVIDLQDAINKLLADMMVASEFGAFPQRYVISQMDSATTLKNSPNEIWGLPAGDGEGQDTSVGQFNAADLTNYYSSIEKLSNSIAIITRTPKHYFFQQGGDPSGEALIAMEAPLNKKCQRYIKLLQPVWAEVAAFLMQLTNGAVEKQDISATFDDPRTIQPYTQGLIRKTNVEAGIPLTTQLKDEGWSDEEIDQMNEDRALEQQVARSTLAAGVLEAQRALNGGGQTNGMEQPE